MRHPVLLLVAAAVPAITGSVLLMRASGAASSLIVQQLVVFVAGVVVAVVVATLRPRGDRSSGPWTMVALALALFVPRLIAAGEGPARWLQLGPMRLYLAPLLIPALLFVLGTRRATGTPTGLFVSSAAAVALWLQPDAAQLTAYACGVAVIVATSGTASSARVAVLGALTVLAVSCWRRPDPLAPVPHVEGVLHLAVSHGVVTAAAAIVAAVLPAIAVTWLAWRASSVALLACGVYFGALVALAPLQVTPVPLLGFGAGPVLGYTALAALVARRLSSIEAPRTGPPDSHVAPE